jgi:YD repeat-containing protein
MLKLLFLAPLASLVSSQIDLQHHQIRGWDSAGRLVLLADPDQELTYFYDSEGRVSRRGRRAASDSTRPDCGRWSGGEANLCLEPFNRSVGVSQVVEETRYEYDSLRRPVGAVRRRRVRYQSSDHEPASVEIKVQTERVFWSWPNTDEEAQEIARLSHAR